MILPVRPISQWPDGWPNEEYRTSPFSTTYDKTLKLLERELDMIAADDPLLAMAVTERDCRIDGGLRAGAKPKYRGVILSFATERYGRLTYPCDTFYRWNATEAWQANLHAIALGLESLRRVERYGIANRGQQYAGYAELGSGIALGPAPMTLHQASVILAEAVAGELPGINGGDLMDDPETPDRAAVERVYTIAAKLHHPDVGGDKDTFATITRARELLLAAGGK